MYKVFVNENVILLTSEIPFGSKINLFDLKKISLKEIISNVKKHKKIFLFHKNSEKLISSFKKKIKVESYEGLTIDFCKKSGANFIVRGIRNNGDFEFEKAIARTNRKLSKIETIFLLTSAKTSFISSGIVRELIVNNGDYKLLVPKSVKID